MLRLSTMEYNTSIPEGTMGFVVGGHAMNVIVLGDNPLYWYDLGKIEPQRNAIIEIGEWYLGTVGDSSLIFIEGAPALREIPNYWAQLSSYLSYSIKDSIPSEGVSSFELCRPYYSYYPDYLRTFPTILRRDSINPTISVISPTIGKVHAYSPKLTFKVVDATIFDMYSWRNGITDTCFCDAIINDSCFGY